MKLSHVVWESERISQQEIIIEEVHGFPTRKEAFQMQNMTIGLCLKGSASFRYDMSVRTMQPHCLGVMLPFHAISDGHWTDDYTTLPIIVSATMYDELITRDAFRDYIKYAEQPEINLSDEQFDKIYNLLVTIRNVNSSSHAKRRDMVVNLLDVLFYGLALYRGDEVTGSNSRNEQLYSRFYDLLMAHYAHHHEIDWYAEQLRLTPKYFSALIRQTSGKSAAQWINSVLVMQAKRLLLSRRDMTVQQVAYELGFRENATFCRFFKSQTGLRPTEYRESEKNAIGI